MTADTQGAAPLVLIVDDDATTNQLLQYTLVRQGFQTLSAFSVAEALNQIRDANPDLILLDVGLPDGTGFDVCQALHKEHGSIPIPILFISANEDVATRVNALEAGAVDYIGKPIAVSEVLARVRTHLRLKEVTAKLSDMHEREHIVQSLVDIAPAALIISDEKTRIRYMNKAAEALFGWKADDVIGADLPKVIAAPQSRKDCEGILSDTRHSPGTKSANIMGLKENGDAIVVELSVTGAELQNGWHTIAVAREIAG